LQSADVLMVGAADTNPRAMEAWRTVFDPAPKILRANGDHLGMVRGANTGPLAQMIQKWIAGLG
jgi:hypothetical protein